MSRIGFGSRFIPVVSGLWFLFAAFPLFAAQADPCAAFPQPQFHVTVARVLDGDTVALVDGRKVRFVGVDAPEVGRRGQGGEPYAQEAQALLANWVARQPVIGLSYDAQRRDHYGRTLAHGVVDGVSIERTLLERGLARLMVIPPNTAQVGCYAAAEARARAQGLGVWSRPEAQVLPAAQLRGHERGYRVVEGRVRSVAINKEGVNLDVEGRLTVHVARADLAYFTQYNVAHLEGQTVQVRARLKAYKGHLSARVHHPLFMEVRQ